MIVNIAYHVPVYVLVDTDEGRIDRVIVDDESIQIDEPLDAREHPLLNAIPAEVAELARKIAEGDDEELGGEWPIWEMGW